MLTQSFVSKLLNFIKSSRVVLTISLFILFGSIEIVSVQTEPCAQKRILSLAALKQVASNSSVDEAMYPSIIQSPGIRSYGPPIPKVPTEHSPFAYGPPIPVPHSERVGFDESRSPLRVR